MSKRLFVLSLAPLWLLELQLGSTVLLALTTMLLMQNFAGYVRHCVAYRQSQLNRPQRGYRPWRRGLL